MGRRRSQGNSGYTNGVPNAVLAAKGYDTSSSGSSNNGGGSSGGYINGVPKAVLAAKGYLDENGNIKSQDSSPVGSTNPVSIQESLKSPLAPGNSPLAPVNNNVVPDVVSSALAKRDGAKDAVINALVARDFNSQENEAYRNNNLSAAKKDAREKSLDAQAKQIVAERNVNEANERGKKRTEAVRNAVKKQIQDLDNNAGYITTPEQHDEYVAKRKELSDKLEGMGGKPTPTAGERIGNVVESGIKGSAAGFVKAFNNLVAMKQKQGDINESFYGGILDAVTGKADSAESAMTARMAALDAVREDSSFGKTYGAVNETATKLNGESSAALAEANRELGAFGQFLTTMGVNGVQMAGDAALNLVLPGASLISLGTRAAGSAMLEAEQAGASLEQQLAYGAVVAGVEVLTEKMFDGLAGIYGKGTADEITEGFIKKIATETNPTVANIAKVFLSGAGEGVEEGISGLINPFAKIIYDGGETLSQEGVYSDLWYDMLVGFAMGSLGGSVDVLTHGGQITDPATGKPLEIGSEEWKQKAITPENKAKLEAEGVNIDEAYAEIAKAQKNVIDATAATESSAQTPSSVEQNVPTQPTVAPQTTEATQTANITPAQQALLDVLQNPDNYSAETGKLSRTAIETIVSNPDLATAFSEASSEAIPATKSQQRTVIRDNAESVINALTQTETATEMTAPQNPTTEAVSPEAITPTADVQQTPAQSPVIPTNPSVSEQSAQQTVNVPTETQTAVETQNVGENGSAQMGVEANGEEVERGGSRNLRTDDARNEQLRAFREENPEMYKRLKNKDTLNAALDIWDSDPTHAEAERVVQEAITNAKNGQKLSPEIVPLGKLLCDELAANGRLNVADQINSDIIAELTWAGQLGQANAILRDASPTARANAFEKMLGRIKTDAKSTLSDEAIKTFVDEYKMAGSDEARNAIVEKAQQAVADTSPTTLHEALTALRYTNMLGNFKTQGRNIIGNTVMLLTTRAKNRMLALEQMGWNKAVDVLGKGEKVERTATLTTDKALYNEAVDLFVNEDAEATLGEGKYSDIATANKGVQDKKTIFKWNWKENSAITEDSILRKIIDLPMKGWEAYRKATSWAMDAGDRIFTKVTYAQTLADYAKAQGYTSLADIDADTLQEMRNYAIKQAQEATFRDSNAVSEAMSNFDANWGKLGKTISQGIMPFRKTPANVGVRMEEYSPLGLINTFVDIVKAKKSVGNADFNLVLDDLSKSLTGTGIAALGFMLAKAGLVRGSEDDDKKASYENNVMGLSDYSVILPDGTSVSVDWLTPSSGAFFLGAAAADALEDGFQADDFLTLLGSITDITMNMSFLSGIQDALENISSFSNDMQAVPQFLLNSFLNYIGQAATNSLVGQAESASEEYRQTTYTDKAGIIPQAAQRTIGKLSAKIPGIDYNQADYIDAWGRKQEQGGIVERIVESFFSPAYWNESRKTSVDDELMRLYDSGNDSVLPAIASRSTTVNETVLSPEEYEVYQTTNGQTALELVSAFLDSDYYKSLDDESRAEKISDLYGYAKAIAAEKIAKSRGEDYESNNLNDYRKAESVMKAGGMDIGDYLEYKDGKGGSQASLAGYLYSKGYSDEKAEAVYALEYPNASTTYSEHKERVEGAVESGFDSWEETSALLTEISEYKAEAKNQWDTAGNIASVDAILGAMREGRISNEQADYLVGEGTSDDYSRPYYGLREIESSPSEAAKILKDIDGIEGVGNSNGGIAQKEILAYYAAHPESEVLCEAVWNAMQYTYDHGKHKTWELRGKK